MDLTTLTGLDSNADAGGVRGDLGERRADGRSVTDNDSDRNDDAIDWRHDGCAGRIRAEAARGLHAGTGIRERLLCGLDLAVGGP